MAEKILPGQWRHQAQIIYRRGTGEYEDDERVGWAGGHDEAKNICKAHNEEIETIKLKLKGGNDEN